MLEGRFGHDILTREEKGRVCHFNLDGNRRKVWSNTLDGEKIVLVIIF